MRKLAFLFVMAVCLVSCGSDNEPTPPTNNDNDTSTNTTPSKPSEPSTPSKPSTPSTPSEPIKPIEPAETTFTLKNISEYNTFTFYVVECGEDVELGKGMQYGCNLLPGATKTFTVPDINYFVTCYKINGVPKSGFYKGKSLNEYPLSCGKITKGKTITNQTGAIYFVNKTDDLLKVYINDGEYISPFTIKAGSSYSIKLDLGYYNIKVYEQDYLMFQDTYEYDVYLGEDKSGTDQLEPDSEQFIYITE